MASIKRNRLTAVIPVTAVFLSPNPLLPEKPAETRPSWVLPVETASVRAVWYCPSEMPPVRRVVDESTGQWVLEYREISPLK
ncbi:MAG TPA: hypothetical protein PK644_09175, partial [bacterium]|nr:hypothetical protein [bacterium]